MPHPPVSLAFIGSSIGYTEMGLLLFVVLLLFGPKKIPELARTIGRVMEELRRASTEFKTQMMSVSEDAREATKVIQEDLSIPRDKMYTSEDEAQSMNPYEMDEYQRRLHRDQAENAPAPENAAAAAGSEAPAEPPASGETPAPEVAAAPEIAPAPPPAATPAVEPAPETRSNG